MRKFYTQPGIFLLACRGVERYYRIVIEDGKGVGGLQGGSRQTPKNGDFGSFRPFLGVCLELP